MIIYIYIFIIFIFSTDYIFVFLISRYFSEKYSGHMQTFKVENFATIIDYQSSLTVSGKLSILDVCEDPAYAFVSINVVASLKSFTLNLSGILWNISYNQPKIF